MRGDKPWGSSCPNQASLGAARKTCATKVRSNAPGSCRVAKQNPARLRGSRRANCTLTRA